jgi:hypothetical protein
MATARIIPAALFVVRTMQDIEKRLIRNIKLFNFNLDVHTNLFASITKNLSLNLPRPA